jgi:hypothetical protein
LSGIGWWQECGCEAAGKPVLVLVSVPMAFGGEDLVHLRGHQGVDDVQGTRLGEAVGERAPLGECLGGAGLPGQALLPGCFEQVGTVGRRRRCAARAAATAGNPLSYRRHGTEACRPPNRRSRASRTIPSRSRRDLMTLLTALTRRHGRRRGLGCSSAWTRRSDCSARRTLGLRSGKSCPGRPAVCALPA